MKKLLALVLALVMTLGLATVGANAATTYADQDDINYEEAVAVMSAIGVLAGDETGFRPTDTLKRSEGAKIVAYLLLGNKAAEAMVGSGTKFTDVPANHWAAGYIEYLASQNVLGGKGNGIFDPDGELTTTQFAKMLLVALGYDAGIEGFGGTDWSINVQKVANQVGLFDGNSAATPNAAVTREEAALYSFNTIMSPLVEYENKGSSVAVNGATIEFGASNWNYKKSNSTAKQTISDQKEVNSGAYLVEFAEEYYSQLQLQDLGYGTDDFGRPTRTWTYNNAKVGEFVSKNALIATWSKKVSAKDLYDLLGKTAYDSLKRFGWTVDANGKYNLTGTYLASAIDGVWQDFDSTSEIDVAAYAATDGKPVVYNSIENSAVIDSYLNRTDTKAVNGSDNGITTELYMDEDHNICLVTYHTWVFQAATDYDSKKDSISLVNIGDSKDITLADRTLKGEDFPEIKDFKADDYILVTATVNETNANRYDVQTVQKAELLTGTIERYNFAADTASESTDKIAIDGTTYNLNQTAGDLTRDVNYTIGQKATVVLDQYGYIIAVDEALVLSDYVFVKQFGSTSGLGAKAIANVVFTDGTKQEIVVKKADTYGAVGDADTFDDVTGSTKETATIADIGIDNGNWNTNAVATNKNAVGNATQAGKWYTYSKDASGEYTLYGLSDKDAQARSVYTAAQVVANGDKVVYFNNAASESASAYTLDQLKINDKTVILVEDQNGNMSVYEGAANAPTITTTAAANTQAFAVYGAAAGGYAKAIYVKLHGNASVSGAQNDHLVYIRNLDNQTKANDQETWYNYNLINLDGTSDTKEGSENLVAGLTNNAYYNTFFVANFATEDADGRMNGMQKAVTGGTVIAGYSGDDNVAGNGAIAYKDGVLYFTGAQKVTAWAANGSVSNVGVGGYDANESAESGYRVTADTKIVMISPKGMPMNSNPSATFEALVAGTGLTAANALANEFKGYNIQFTYAGRLTSATSDVLEELYVTVKAAVRVVTASDDASIANIVVNGVTATASAAADVDYEVTLTPNQAANFAGLLTNKIVVNATDGDATPAVAAFSWDTAAHAVDNGATGRAVYDNAAGAFNAAGTERYYSITVTAADTTTAETYILKVTTPAYWKVIVANTSGASVLATMDGNSKIIATGNDTADDDASCIGYVADATATALTLLVSDNTATDPIALNGATGSLFGAGNGSYTLSATANSQINVPPVTP